MTLDSSSVSFILIDQHFEILQLAFLDAKPDASAGTGGLPLDERWEMSSPTFLLRELSVLCRPSESERCGESACQCTLCFARP